MKTPNDALEELLPRFVPHEVLLGSNAEFAQKALVLCAVMAISSCCGHLWTVYTKGWDVDRMVLEVDRLIAMSCWMIGWPSSGAQ